MPDHGRLGMAKTSVANLIAGLLRGRPRAVAIERGAPRAGAAGRRERRVRLIEAAARPPVTPVERLVVATLARQGAMPLDQLGEQVALDLYRDALSRGAGILDLGFFGKDLFIPEAILEIETGDGALWKIESVTHGGSGGGGAGFRPGPGPTPGGSRAGRPAPVPA